MTPLQTEFYGRMGKTLLEVQLAEQLLQNCLSYFLRAGEAKTVEEIEAMAAADRRKSLTRTDPEATPDRVIPDNSPG
jgi:hypothetical protein